MGTRETIIHLAKRYSKSKESETIIIAGEFGSKFLDKIIEIERICSEINFQIGSSNDELEALLNETCDMFLDNKHYTDGISSMGYFPSGRSV